VATKTKPKNARYGLHVPATPEAIDEYIKKIESAYDFGDASAQAAARAATSDYCKDFVKALSRCDMGHIELMASSYFRGFEAGMAYIVDRLHSHFGR
jgi:hypothetical protein